MRLASKTAASILMLLALSSGSILSAQDTAAIRLKPASVIGPVKPVNGTGQAPLIGYSTDMFHYLGEAGIPYVRTHDVGGAFGRNLYFDIPNLFRDFDADETDPSNYDFTFTDIYVKALVDNGVEPFFRLGVTIENESEIRAYRVFPPKDFAKWARICEHVIRHYNEGWADGFHFNIRNWEIWNEPDNHQDIVQNDMWKGTWEQYMELYKVAAGHLKSCFPELNIGGYGSCGFYAVTGKHVPGANSSPRHEYFMDCFHSFLDFVRDNSLPLDFFSMHSYAAPDQALRQICYARHYLDSCGFKDTRISFNEWLPTPSREMTGTTRQAALIAAELIGLQNGPVDDAEIYDARCQAPGTYSPLFNAVTLKPFQAYYGFMMFNELRRLGNQIVLEGIPDTLYATAAASEDKSECAVMMANISKEAVPFRIKAKGYEIREVLAIDKDHTYEAIGLPDAIKEETVLLIRLSR